MKKQNKKNNKNIDLYKLIDLYFDNIQGQELNKQILKENIELYLILKEELIKQKELNNLVNEWQKTNTIIKDVSNQLKNINSLLSTLETLRLKERLKTNSQNDISIDVFRDMLLS